MNRVVRMVIVAGTMTVGLVLSFATPADAACHHFTVSASPNPVGEGKVLTVTVSRDANVAPSHVDVSSIDESAKAGQDYQALSRTVSFTNDIQQSFPISITSHTSSEPARTFRLHLSNPGGCAVNPNFVLDPDVRVTIAANGVPATTAAPGVPRTTATTATGARTTVPTSSAATVSTALGTSSSSSQQVTTPTPSSTSATRQALPATKRGGGGSGGAVIASVVVAGLVLAGGGYLLYRRGRG